MIYISFIAAKYLTTVMVLNMLSVVASIFVIRIYHTSNKPECDLNKANVSCKKHTITPLKKNTFVESSNNNERSNTEHLIACTQAKFQSCNRCINLVCLDKFLFSIFLFANIACLFVFILVPFI